MLLLFFDNDVPLRFVLFVACIPEYVLDNYNSFWKCSGLKPVYRSVCWHLLQCWRESFGVILKYFVITLKFFLWRKCIPLYILYINIYFVDLTYLCICFYFWQSVEEESSWIGFDNFFLCWEWLVTCFRVRTKKRIISGRFGDLLYWKRMYWIVFFGCVFSRLKAKLTLCTVSIRTRREVWYWFSYSFAPTIPIFRCNHQLFSVWKYKLDVCVCVSIFSHMLGLGHFF